MWAVCGRLFILPSKEAQEPLVLFPLLRRVWGCVLPYSVVITLEFQFIRATATRYNNNIHLTERFVGGNLVSAEKSLCQMFPSKRLYRFWFACVSVPAAGVSGV